jgi:aminoglycoside phosphotransferase (APT) family kinase protein
MVRQPAVLQRVASVLGQQPLEWQRPECGLSTAERWVTRLAGDSSVFVKAATDADTAAWLETERDAVAAAGDRFAPRVIAWLDDDLYPVLVTEDLSGAYWPAGTGTVHWRSGDSAAVLSDLEQLSAVPPGELPTIDDPPRRWAELLATDVLSRAGLCTDSWIANNGSALVSADRLPIVIDRPSLVHGDVRSDNLCIIPDGTVRFVDWAQAGAGHPRWDLVNFLPTLHLEGGPAPATVLTEPIGLITRLAGCGVARAVCQPDGPEWLRTVLLQLAKINLEWVSSILGVEPPDGRTAA